MTAAERLASYEAAPLPWAEICRRYPDQYVCLVDTVRPEPRHPEILSARVVGHGATDDEAFDPIRERAVEFPRFAIRYTGETAIAYIRPTFILDDEDLEPVRP